MKKTEEALLKGLVHLIWADGKVSAEERELLGHVLVELGVTDEQVAQVGQMLIEPPDLRDLKKSVKDHASRVEILKVLLTMAMADGKAHSSEMRFLDKMAEHLEVSPQELESLKRETFEGLEA